MAGLLTLFSGAMLGVVLADNLIILYGFWELTSVTSFLLIGNQYRQPAARSAALQAILVTGAGGLVMLLGFVILGQAAGTYQLSALLADVGLVLTEIHRHDRGLCLLEARRQGARTDR